MKFEFFISGFFSKINPYPLILNENDILHKTNDIID